MSPSPAFPPPSLPLHSPMAFYAVAPPLPLTLRPAPSTLRSSIFPRAFLPRSPLSISTPLLPSKALNPSLSSAAAATATGLFLRRRTTQCAAASSSSPPSVQDLKLQEWDSTTGKFAAAANVPFLLLQLPQIVLNARNLLAGNKAALFAVPWLGMLTGLLGNLSLVSYFAKKRETEAVLVQTLGVVSTYAVIAQLAMAESMPLPHFVVTSVVVASGLVLNFLNYFGWLNETVWGLWEDFIAIGGVSVLPQVMWSTFVPLVPNSILPGMISCAAMVVAIVMARAGKLSEGGMRFVGSISGWTATLLFMWMPVAQMWTNYLNPDNIRGLSAFTMLLAMIGNGLMIPRAVFIRDLMWFTGSAWATFLHGWGNLLCMYCFNTIRREFFFATTLGLSLWLGTTLWRDTVAYGYTSPTRSLKELVFGVSDHDD